MDREASPTPEAGVQQVAIYLSFVCHRFTYQQPIMLRTCSQKLKLEHSISMLMRRVTNQFCYGQTRCENCSILVLRRFFLPADAWLYLFIFSSSLSMSALQGVEILIFDVFGTVVDWRSSITKALEDLGKQHSLQGSIVINPHFFGTA